MLTISVVGKRAVSFLEELDRAGIEYERRMPKPGVVMNSGDTIRFVEDVTKVAVVLAPVLIAWVGANKARRIQITTKQREIVSVSAQGMSAEDVAKCIHASQGIIVLEGSDNLKKLE